MRKERTVITCDITGKPADETVEFALDRVGYVIDLTEKNANKLRLALAPYITAGRRATAARTVRQTGRVREITQGVGRVPRPARRA